MFLMQSLHMLIYLCSFSFVYFNSCVCLLIMIVSFGVKLQCICLNWSVWFLIMVVYFGVKLQCTDEDLIDGAVSILRALIFKTNFPSIRNSPLELHQMESVFPLLLNLLDERDSIARAVVLLTAEFCFLYPS